MLAAARLALGLAVGLWILWGVLLQTASCIPM
jgi:hypothetical protein